MKSGPEIVKAGLRSFFESAADDIEKMVENLKLGKVSKGNQVKRKTLKHLLIRFFSDLISVMFLYSKSKGSLRTLTTPPSPYCRCSPPCSITSLSTCLETMLSVSGFTLHY